MFKGYDCDMDEGDDINISDNSKDLSGSDDDAFDKLVKGPVDSGPTSKEQDSNMVMGLNAKIVTSLSDNDQPYEFEMLLRQQCYTSLSYVHTSYKPKIYILCKGNVVYFT